MKPFDKCLEKLQGPFQHNAIDGSTVSLQAREKKDSFGVSAEHFEMSLEFLGDNENTATDLKST